MDACVDGKTVHLLGAVRTKSGAMELRHSRRHEGEPRWSSAVNLPTGHGPLHGSHRGNDPQVAAQGDRLIAIWGTSGEGFMGSGPMRSALSGDGGKTWTAGPAPAPQERPLSQGFCDLVFAGDGVELLWLGSHEGKRALLHARSVDRGNSWGPATAVDPETCECCWNRLAQGGGGEVFALYRDKAPRDLRVAVKSAGEWKILPSPAVFNWQVEACPHAGGGLAVGAGPGSGGIHVTLWTGGERGGLYYTGSKDGGRSWSPAHKLAEVTAPHSDLARLSDGRLVAVWSAPRGGKTAIFQSWSLDDGRTWEPEKAISSPGFSATHPRVFSLGERALALWTERIGEEEVRIRSGERMPTPGQPTGY